MSTMDEKFAMTSEDTIGNFAISLSYSLEKVLFNNSFDCPRRQLIERIIREELARFFETDEG